MVLFFKKDETIIKSKVYKVNKSMYPNGTAAPF